MSHSLAPALRPHRSFLSVPAINQRALTKISSLACDGVIFDLEDSVSFEKKHEARTNLSAHFAEPPAGDRLSIIRINPLLSKFGADDLALVVSIHPDAILLPKVESADDLQTVERVLDEAGVPDTTKIWAMIETAKGVLNAGAIASSRETSVPRLQGFVVGLNDLRKETRIPARKGRSFLIPFLMQVVLAARAHGLCVIDSVFNDFRDAEGFEDECIQGRDMGFDGKMLIHPAQIDPANHHFGPDPEAVAEAEAIIAAFSTQEAQTLNVINLNGRMIERLHLVEAERLVQLARLIGQSSRIDQSPFDQGKTET
ncbi:citrate lyase subunit beta/citryl-CoA lyase [Neorhizobium galegae]|uniref:HpcH/HpaI aldolase/citrate lyase family protein n=1 Tax=Neorhizobium galegae TaxID=399 RepID=UPI001AE8681F|nr:CoA ester lyase [Neorhizobium galegae]MBP2551265.1 citrate lyase subunit beta/citryl-CoA lyase [Neorhizobium galegae]